MSVLVMTSATGAPGVTTTALGLALSWPREVLLLDADRDPAQAIPAGYLRGVDVVGKGLTALASAHRERRVEGLGLDQLALTLESEGAARAYVPGFSHPGAAALFRPVWPTLAALLAEEQRDVVIDAGRIGREGLPDALLSSATGVAVVCRTSLPALAALRLHLPGLQQALDELAAPAALGLVLVGPGRPYTAAEISSQFGLPVWAGVAFDTAGAAVWSEGSPEPRGFARSPYARSVSAAAERLAARVGHPSGGLRGVA